MVGVLSGPEGQQRLVGRESVRACDLWAARDTVFLAGLRTGQLGPNLHEQRMQVIPGESRGADRLAGYVIELVDGPRSFRRNFGIQTLKHVALRGWSAAKEGAAQSTENGEELAYYLTTAPAAARHADPTEALAKELGAGARIVTRAESLVLEPAPLREFMARSVHLQGPSTTDDEIDPGALCVFATAEVIEQGRTLARRGGEVESAAVLTGRLFRDTDSPEVFLVVDAAIEAEFAIEEKFAVTMTGDSWSKIRQTLDVRRRRLGRPHERIVGSVHGHNFFPEADADGQRMCARCATAPFCNRTTATASLADFDWHQTVFSGAPWAILWVWGFNAREQDDWRIYGLSDAALLPRGIRRLEPE